MHRRLFGVDIGGVPWKVGRYCMYLNGANGATHLGMVVGMICGMDAMEDLFVIFQVDKKQITKRMGHYCLFSDDTQTTEYVSWTQVTWVCKTLKV
jgi:hypothetical protein